MLRLGLNGLEFNSSSGAIESYLTSSRSTLSSEHFGRGGMGSEAPWRYCDTQKGRAAVVSSFPA
jgi:hypothetical protein